MEVTYDKLYAEFTAPSHISKVRVGHQVIDKYRRPFKDEVMMIMIMVMMVLMVMVTLMICVVLLLSVDVNEDGDDSDGDDSDNVDDRSSTCRS